ncbi:MAG: redox-sensing transcriptional repressor Rex [Candidatus Eisenbacteria bacterium]|nr:redox-sensing transcriptional repressor Rex [Candidatus Latescibacterota bacterium]MBD3301097.1 redox-sensing transcriptional repressor Rex [Candidatus Eisenbacteria bacterium]
MSSFAGRPARERRLLHNLSDRLPLYYRLSERRIRSGEDAISVGELAAAVEVEADTILEDLQVLGIDPGPEGRVPVGTLHDVSEHLLGLRPVNTAILVGMGRLGSAIASYEGFGPFGMRIIGVFDSDPAKIGRFVGGLRILPMEQLEDVCTIFEIRLAVLAVAPEAAQETAARLVRAGVQAIWNFAPVELEVPAEVVVRNEDLAAGLAQLCRDLREANLRRLPPEGERK